MYLLGSAVNSTRGAACDEVGGQRVVPAYRVRGLDDAWAFGECVRTPADCLMARRFRHRLLHSLVPLSPARANREGSGSIDVWRAEISAG